MLVRISDKLVWAIQEECWRWRGLWPCRHWQKQNRKTINKLFTFWRKNPRFLRGRNCPCNLADKDSALPGNECIVFLLQQVWSPASWRVLQQKDVLAYCMYINPGKNVNTSSKVWLSLSKDMRPYQLFTSTLNYHHQPSSYLLHRLNSHYLTKSSQSFYVQIWAFLEFCVSCHRRNTS